MANVSETKLVSKLLDIKKQAKADISKFEVGCIIEDIFGRFFYGANSEYTNRNAGLCAESAAIADMISSVGATKIKNIYLCGSPQNDQSYKKATYPCGLCRQRLAELSDEATHFYAISITGKLLDDCNFFELLPHKFTLESSKEITPFLSTKREPLILDSTTNISSALKELSELSFNISGKKEACIIQLDDDTLIGGNYFGTSCYKADIDAKTSAYSKIARFNLWKKIKEVHFVG